MSIGIELTLNVAGRPVLAIGGAAAGVPPLQRLIDAGASIKLVHAPEDLSPAVKALSPQVDLWEDDYSRHYLTPRPALVLLISATDELRATVRRDAHHRGLLLIDLEDRDARAGEATYRTP